MFNDDEVKCTCGHRLVNHGDRAVGACDGAISDKTRTPMGRTGSLCYCPGWTPGSLH
jgi:hypothetical protein